MASLSSLALLSRLVALSLLSSRSLSLSPLVVSLSRSRSLSLSLSLYSLSLSLSLLSLSNVSLQALNSVWPMLDRMVMRIIPLYTHFGGLFICSLWSPSTSKTHSLVIPRGRVPNLLLWVLTMTLKASDMAYVLVLWHFCPLVKCCAGLLNRVFGLCLFFYRNREREQFLG